MYSPMDKHKFIEVLLDTREERRDEISKTVFTVNNNLDKLREHLKSAVIKKLEIYMFLIF